MGVNQDGDWICAPNKGCQADYKDTWFGYFTSTALLDAFLAIPLSLCMLAVKSVWEPRLGELMRYGDTAYFVVAVIPLIGWIFGVPVWISPTLLVLLSLYLMR